MQVLGRLLLLLAMGVLLFPLLVLGGGEAAWSPPAAAGLMVAGFLFCLPSMGRYQFHGPIIPARPHLRAGRQLTVAPAWRHYLPMAVYCWVMTVLLSQLDSDYAGLTLPTALLGCFAVVAPVLQRGNPARERAILASQLACLVRMGIPLPEGLDKLAQDARARRASRYDGLPQVLSYLAQDLRAGAQLSHALSCQAYFPAYWSSLVEIGERTEQLTEELDQLSQLESLRQAPAGLLRPVLTMLILGYAGIFVHSYLYPTFVGMAQANGGTSHGLWAMGLAGQLSYLLFFGCLLAAPALLLGGWRIRWVQRFWDELVYRMPGLGQMVRVEQQSFACLALRAGARNGRSLAEMLRLAQEAVTSPPYRDLLRPERALAGSNLAGLLAESPGLFAPEVIWLLRQAENLGDPVGGLELALAFLADLKMDLEARNALALQVGLTLTAGMLVALYTFGLWLPAVAFYDHVVQNLDTLP